MVEHVPRPLRLRQLALAAVARTAVPADGDHAPEASMLRSALDPVLASNEPLGVLLDDCLRSPAPEDQALCDLDVDLCLTPIELLTVALASAAEDDPAVGRIVSHVQAPLAGARPTLGLLSRAFRDAFCGESDGVVPALLNGAAFRTGLLGVVDDKLPLCEQAVMVPAAICLALTGQDGRWPGAVIGVDESARVPLPASTLEAARRHADALAVAEPRTLVIRSSSPAEARSTAAVIAQVLGRRAAFLEPDHADAVGPWLVLRGLVPVFCCEPGPGEVRRLPRVAGYAGPTLVVAGLDGAIEPPEGAAATWTLPVPSSTERRILWWAALGDSALASEMGDQFRHPAGRIAHLARLARHEAALAGRPQPTVADVFQASWSAEGAGLDALAHPVRGLVADEALVVTPRLRGDLESVLARCRLRDDLAAGLGASATTRYSPGVRALFVGPSGTGKTLAAGWMATQLHLPLYRVDLASVTSKYIGETEKNLSQLLARAEQAEVILLFDEADSLFGKRTEVTDANDRFANSQTNYLLQRIETYAGIVILTSNCRGHIDPAFARRLDFIVEFPMPGPEERRALWQSHLGSQTVVQPPDLNQLAALLDLSGGHIRNAVLAAAVRARQAGRAIAFEDLLAGAASELSKLGRQLPMELRATR